MKVSEMICLLAPLPQNAPVIILDNIRNQNDDGEGRAGVYSEIEVEPMELMLIDTEELVQGVALSFQNRDNTDDLVSQLMEAKILLDKIKNALISDDKTRSYDPEYFSHEKIVDACDDMSSEISSLIEP